ncbi:PTS lactose/cellobiose transporter subunit IIA, partial [Marinococcus halophilus]
FTEIFQNFCLKGVFSMDTTYEQDIFEIISNAGDAKSLAYESLEMVENKDYKEADENLQLADDQLKRAHNTQTRLIQNEINGDKVTMSLLMVHAQDHLMGAESEITLIKHLISLQKQIHGEKTSS